MIINFVDLFRIDSFLVLVACQSAMRPVPHRQETMDISEISDLSFYWALTNDSFNRIKSDPDAEETSCRDRERTRENVS